MPRSQARSVGSKNFARRPTSSPGLGGAALQREEAARAPLDEEDDGHEDGDLAEDRPGDRFEKLVDDAERQRADQRPQQIADAAEDNDEKAVDDVNRAEIGADIADLGERHAGHPGDAGAEAEG